MRYEEEIAKQGSHYDLTLSLESWSLVISGDIKTVLSSECLWSVSLNQKIMKYQHFLATILASAEGLVTVIGN